MATPTNSPRGGAEIAARMTPQARTERARKAAMKRHATYYRIEARVRRSDSASIAWSSREEDLFLENSPRSLDVCRSDLALLAKDAATEARFRLMYRIYRCTKRGEFVEAMEEVDLR